jgi:hypothetical protein
MEREELSICKTMFERNLDLILNKHIMIDLDQFSAMEKEYRCLLRDKLSDHMKKQMDELRQKAHMCKRMIRKCPN